MLKKLDPKIETELRELYLHGLEYYVHFLSFVDFYESNDVPTMGVTVKNYRMAFAYNPAFLAEQDPHSLRYLILHEADHLIWGHCKRIRGKNIPHDHANIVQDMVINYNIDKYFGHNYRKTEHSPAYKLSSRPVGVDGKETGCRAPDEYIKLVESGKADMVFEPLYQWLKDNNKLENQPQPFDTHMDMDEATQELLQRIVHEASEKAKAASRGHKHGGIDAILALSLHQPKKDNLRQVRLHCQAIRGMVKFPSYRKPNRKVDGIKGNTKTGHAITCLWDWSGSMDGYHEIVASALYKDGYEINILGGDTAVGNIFKVTKKEQLKKIPFRGGGGTVLQPMVDFIRKDRKLNKAPLVVLTDGYTDTLDFSGFKRVLVLTAAGFVPLVGPQAWVKQLKIEL